MNRHFLGAVGAVSFLVLGACAATSVTAPPLPAASVSAAMESASAETAADRIKSDITYLADDAREGREAGTSGYLDAANYVAARMASIGLEPAGENGWFQQVTLRSVSPIVEEAALSVTKANGETVELSHLEDFEVYPSPAVDVMDVSAPVVFVGYGVHAPEKGHDDYAGLDVKGKIVAYFNGAPDIFQTEERAHFGSNSAKAQTASDMGAVGMITLYSIAGEKSFPWERAVSNPNRKRMTWVHPDGRSSVSGENIQGTALLNPGITQMLFEGAEKSFQQVREEVEAEGVSPKGFELKTSVSMRGAHTKSEVKSPNVAGLIEGADPVLKNEYVVLSAHLDHIGMNQKLIDEGKDGINNGAFDNASGVSTMLEAARMLLSGERPARSVIVLAVTAEEKGLLGADYFAHYPTKPKSAIVANVNLDMPLVMYPFADIVAFGAERSSLGPIVRDAAAKIGVKLSPDPLPQEGLFTRSDHYRFVQQGVPAVFIILGFENGGEEVINNFLQNNYHRPSDDLNLPIDFEQAARFAEINYLIAKDLANAEERPHWNEGDFFGDMFAK